LAFCFFIKFYTSYRGGNKHNYDAGNIAKKEKDEYDDDDAKKKGDPDQYDDDDDDDER
jgi:hypothetical protein